jgi:hypothetical protein
MNLLCKKTKIVPAPNNYYIKIPISCQHQNLSQNVYWINLVQTAYFPEEVTAGVALGIFKAFRQIGLS